MEIGATFAQNLSDYNFWIALLLVITNRDGKRGSLGGWGKYGGSKLWSEAYDLCGGDENRTTVCKVTARYLTILLTLICTIWAFLSILPK